MREEFVIKWEGNLLGKRWMDDGVVDLRTVEGSWKKFERMKEGKMEGI